jgi:hypothetical protein
MGKAIVVTFSSSWQTTVLNPEATPALAIDASSLYIVKVCLSLQIYSAIEQIGSAVYRLSR